MGPFKIQPHSRLQEWVADEKRYFREEGLELTLEPGGCFVIEVYVPELQRVPPGETIHAFTVTPTHLGFEEYDVATQLAFSHHYWVVDGQLETRSTPHRYVWPSELDLMARLAGMELESRHADWTGAEFTAGSRSHVSVYRLPAGR